MESKNKILSLCLALVLLLSIPQFATAENGSAKEVKTKITSFKIENSNHETVDSVYYANSFYLAMDWETDPSVIVHEGDYFTVKIPDEMKFKDGPSAYFDITDNGVVIAKAQVKPGPNEQGGEVLVTFTSAANDKYNVHGNMFLAANFVEQKITLNEPNTFLIEVESEVTEISVTPSGPQEIVDEHLSKWGYQNPHSDYEANWTARINHMKDDLKNVVIADSLGNQEAEYIPESFKLSVGEYNSTGTSYIIIEEVDISDKLTISEDKKSFTINLGDTNGNQYRLSYRTTYIPGMRLKNNMTITAEGNTWQDNSTFISQQSGGTGTGELANKIKLIKTDEDDETVLLAGAEFVITKPNGSTFTLTTDANGEAVSDALIAGDYEVRELSAPDGYILSDEVYMVTVNNGAGAVKTITNKKEEPEHVRISVSVNKNWDDEDDKAGIRPESVTITLLADGEDIGKSLLLTEENNWAGSFTDLEEYNNGTKIAYSVNEEAVSGYETTISGDADEGFTITNKYIPLEELTTEPTIVVEPTTAEEKTVKVLSESDEAEPDASEENDSDTEKTKGKTSPKTGDETKLVIWISVAIVCGLLAAWRYRRKRD